MICTLKVNSYQSEPGSDGGAVSVHPICNSRRRPVFNFFLDQTAVFLRFLPVATDPLPPFAPPLEPSLFESIAWKKNQY